MDTSKLLQSRWLSGVDVEPFTNVTVHSVTQEEVGRDKEIKLIVWFEEFDKGLVCNRTNTKNLIALLGAGDTDDWKGKQIQLYATNQEFGGEEYNVVRVRAVQPAGTGSRAKANGSTPPADDGDLADNKVFQARALGIYGKSIAPAVIADKLKAAGIKTFGDTYDGDWRKLDVEKRAKLLRQADLDNSGF
jgi:hypothetical protein